MTLNELFYAFALCLYMTGAAISFRSNGSLLSRLIMSLAILVDFLLSVLPRFGVDVLSMHVSGSNQVVVAGVLLGVGVWVLFGVTLLFCHYRKYRLYHIGVLFVEVLWFIDFITFLYGIYKYPLY